MNAQGTYLQEATLSQIVTTNFKTAAVFEKYNLDFCCRGNKLISEACLEKGINKEMVMSELKSIFEVNSTDLEQIERKSPELLIDHIINTHHTYVRNMIPLLQAHTQKIASVHGANHPEVIEIARIFAIVYKDLKQHMMKEEEILFPYIKQLVKVSKNLSKSEKPYFTTVKNPIKMMEMEHEAAGDGLFEIRHLSSNYTPPQDACNTFKITYQELKEFEEDLHRHVHLENNILFPEAIKLEEMILAD